MMKKMSRKQEYRHGMPAKYSKGLSKDKAKRRAAAQKLRSKKYKENPDDPTLYEPLPGDDKAPTKRSKYADGK